MRGLEESCFSFDIDDLSRSSFACVDYLFDHSVRLVRSSSILPHSVDSTMDFFSFTVHHHYQFIDHY